jgi:hypothetical protein
MPCAAKARPRGMMQGSATMRRGLTLLMMSAALAPAAAQRHRERENQQQVGHHLQRRRMNTCSPACIGMTMCVCSSSGRRLFGAPAATTTCSCAPLPPSPPAPSPPPVCLSSSWGKGTAYTESSTAYESSSYLTTGDYGAPKTLDSQLTSTFWLSNNGPEDHLNQWIIYRFGGGVASSAEHIAGIKIWPGQAPFGVKDFKMQTADTASGPWNDVYSSTVPSCAGAGSCSHMYTWPAVRSPYWRLFVFNSQDGVARPKIMEVEFSVCS